MSEAALPRPWLRACAWLAFLAPFFFLTYGAANAYAAAQADVPSIVFAWEASIPFLAWTIVPYWSIDVFYALSLFACRDRRELDTHALRLVAAQAIAVACFVLWPLQFSATRPDSAGVFGAMFAALEGFDKPFNQAPSLHIVLLVLLWLRFGAHVRRPAARWALHAWAVLIGASVLTTYQHHFIDIPTGMLVGFLCAWLWPMRVPPPWRTARLARDPARWRLAAVYALGAAVSSTLAIAFGGSAWWLLWPAVSLALVALGYAWLGPNVFQKQADGRLSVASTWLFAPYLAGAWINSRLWTRHAPAPVEVADDVWLGRVPSGRDASGFAAIIDCGAELAAPRGVPVTAVPMLDLVAPSAAALRAAAEAIATARQGQGRVLVCCALGWSRSAASVTAWLVLSGRADSLEQALDRVRSARATIVLHRAHRRALAAATAPVHP